MVKTKILAITASAALLAAAGLTACGGQTPSSSSASTNTSASSSAANSNANSNASKSNSNAASPASKKAEETLVSWQGALTDGTIVDYISSDDGKNGGFVLTKVDANGKEDAKKWLGAMTATDDGKVTITDDETKEAISFKIVDIAKDGTATIDVEGHGAGVIVPMSAADWARLAEAEAIAETLSAKTNSVGMFEDGKLIVYMENPEGTEGFVAIMDENAKEPKTWMGKATTAPDGKETITDDKTGETFDYTWSQDKETGVITINADKYGKAYCAEMTVGDWLILDELDKELSAVAPAKTATSTSNTSNTTSNTSAAR